MSTVVQSPTLHSAVPGHGSLWWHGSTSMGFTSPSHDLSSRAICSSLPRLRTHITVLLWRPFVPHVTEQCCQGPVHHLHTGQSNIWRWPINSYTYWMNKCKTRALNFTLQDKDVRYRSFVSHQVCVFYCSKHHQQFRPPSQNKQRLLSGYLLNQK